MTWRSSEHPCPCGLGPVHQLVALTLGTSEPAGCSVCALRLHLSGHRKWRKEGLPRLVSGVGVSLMLMPVSHESHVGIPCWLCCPGQRFLGPFGCPCSVARRSGNIFHEGARALKPEPRVPKAPHLQPQKKMSQAPFGRQVRIVPASLVPGMVVVGGRREASGPARMSCVPPGPSDLCSEVDRGQSTGPGRPAVRPWRPATHIRPAVTRAGCQVPPGGRFYITFSGALVKQAWEVIWPQRR